MGKFVKKKAAASFDTSLNNFDEFGDSTTLNSTRKDREDSLAIIEKYKPR
jgi:hypothetical protein